MRITLVGPAFPWRGGLPLLVTDLAHRLTAAGHAVTLRTWSAQGPARLLPVQRLAAPEAPAFPAAATLSWRGPLSWWRTGRAAAASDLVILTHYTTLQAPALAAVGARARRGARVVLLCANAVPHEHRPGDRALTRLLLHAADAAVAHTPAEAATLRALADRPVAVAALPPHLPAPPPDGPPAPRPPGPPQRRLLFFGKVRRYKGVDVLLRALARLDGVALTVAGEVYPDAADLPALVGRLGLGGRVDLAPGYVPADRLPDLFAGVDALVLPYRTATASQHVALAHAHGLPVVATRVGNFPQSVQDGVDGLLCAPDDVDDLERALRALYAHLPALRAGVAPADAETTWKAYLDALLTV
jgi:glycosyltransferase involved in cell wall biosynthesis